MNWKEQRGPLMWLVGGFLVCYFLPVGGARFDGAILEAFQLVKWYAREHVLLCLVPAFFIAGAISVFVSQASVMKYLGAGANKILAYGVAAVSGTVLAVCSCTVLPLFAGIYRMGAGLGPACAFLYSGPAINVLAIILTARILGMDLGIARAVGAIAFSVIIGLLMHFFFRKEETEKTLAQAGMSEPEVARPLWKTTVYFALMVLILVFSNWGAPNEYRFRLEDGTRFDAAILATPEQSEAPDAFYWVRFLDGPEAGKENAVPVSEIAEKTPVPGIWSTIWLWKWQIASAASILFAIVLVLWFGLPAWKVAAAAVPTAILALALPMHGLMVLVPFSAGIIGLSWILGSEKEGESTEWLASTWGFAKQIMPLLLGGVLVAGFLLGRPDHEGMIPGQWVEMLVGNSPDTFFAVTGLGEIGPIRTIWPLWTNLFASVFGAFMYFATLTEVPILQGLIGSGMGKGPALALLLAGPALSLPNMLVIRSIMGTKKTAVFVLLVVVMATISGIGFGFMIG